MQKLIIASVALLTFCATGFAQRTRDSIRSNPKLNAVKSTKDTKANAKVVSMNKSDHKPKPKAVKATDGSGTVLKKDGTADKRYKSKPPQHLKADGTLDKRFKGNKKTR